MNSRNDREEKKDAQSRPGNKSQAKQKGAQSVSSKHTASHRKDNSDGEERNVTQKQGNSI